MMKITWKLQQSTFQQMCDQLMTGQAEDTKNWGFLGQVSPQHKSKHSHEDW